MTVIYTLPKFRNGNSVLDNVKRSKTGFLKGIFYRLKEKLESTIVGIIAVVVVSILGASKLYEMVQTYILPLAKKSAYYGAGDSFCCDILCS